MTEFIYNIPSISDVSLLMIAGPTGSGKSKFVHRIAQKYNGVILNADSCQIYKQCPIITARPEDKVIDGIDYKLYGYVDLKDEYSVYDWCNDVSNEIDNILSQRKLPILVGGTGLYFLSLINGISYVPPIDPEIRLYVRGMKNDEIYSILREKDPISVKKFHVNDTHRIMRALEVVLSTDHTLEYWHRNKARFLSDDFHIKNFALMPERDALYQAINIRFDNMIKEGALEEAKQILQDNLADYAGNIIGLKEIIGYYNSEYDLNTATEKAKQASRNYAKRQYTWFRNKGDFVFIENC